MKALVSRVPGPPESLVLEDVPEAEPGPRDVRIRVAACGVNFPDVLIVQDKYQIKPPRPFIPGAEVAGIVECVGADVSTVAAWRQSDGRMQLGRDGGKTRGARRSVHARAGRHAAR